ncbi:MAG TPA: methyltransferase domain-containing protein [Candidatus Dormibacteraeota bacterium]|nr:methyltransferase domain-containing protein [Candidatus Dormibacteraeota bacterium]
MDHADLVALIRDGVVPGRWADLGSGDGAFTLALADLLGAGARILSVDRDGRALSRQRQSMQARFPEAAVKYVKADFTRGLELPALDGVVMANSLHFVRRREPVLDLVRRALVPGGRLVVVEYDADRGNLWVPHPFSYATWEGVAAAAGFVDTSLLARRPSPWLGAMYSALSFRPA